jgi:tRNA (guanine-N7-)-methyltransferase
VGKNKLKRFDEIATFEHVIQAEFDEIFHRDYNLKGHWHDTYFKNNHPIVLELGCGKGEYTVGLAEMFPDKNFIGIDIKGARMHQGAKLAKEKNLQNAAFVRTRIEFIESFFASNEVSEIWLTFPDPQMKKATKRLTSTYFLKKYAGFMVADGLVHLKTDSQFLYTYTSELVKANQFSCIVNQTDLYNNGFADEILSLKTHYESQWLSKGIAIKYLSFLLNSRNELKEPEIEIEFDNYHTKGGNYREKEFAKGERMSGQ